MPSSNGKDFSRRQFLQTAAAACVAGAMLEARSNTAIAVPGKPIVAIDTGENPTRPVQWAANLLRQRLEEANITAVVSPSYAVLKPADFVVKLQREMRMSREKEATNVMPGDSAIFVFGMDEGDFVSSLTELADRVRYAADPLQSLREVKESGELAANKVRSIMRMFVSDVEDKAWYQSKDFWPPYLDMLASQRFNRFNLAFGLGYDAASRLRDTYLYFAYPFLMGVQGYKVRAVGLPDKERDLNLEMLKYISSEVAARGMQFQLGIWTHAFKWIDSPNANYVIDGLTDELQGPYCRDALHRLLMECPDVTGVTLRVHGESGVPEGSYDFWKMLFSGIVATGRKIEIDMHAKGMDQPMIDIALATGLPVKVSPKFWAEHMGLPYMQASIRQTEMPTAQAAARTGMYSLSSGSRSFLRYSFGDLLKSDRKYGVLHRVWPGTQHLLLWGDPTYAAEYGKLFSFLGTDGVEYFDPLAFKGRKGSGLKGDRGGYADASLQTPGAWEKYEYTYRLLGRLAYNPDCDPEVWRRQLEKDFLSRWVETALSSASRILPLITSAHDPSAANSNYSPEMYLNMPMAEPAAAGPYTDTPRPHIFTTVSPLDPQIFATIEESAHALLKGEQLAKVTAQETASALSFLAIGASQIMNAQGGPGAVGDSIPLRRATVDIEIQRFLGEFFALKIRAGILFAMFNATGHEPTRAVALVTYLQAADAWKKLATGADAYAPDLTFGPEPQLRGHWRDRLAAIEKDTNTLVNYKAAGNGPAPTEAMLAQIDKPSPRPTLAIQHSVPTSFQANSPISLNVNSTDGNLAAVKLWYRHVNQAELYQSIDMQKSDNTFAATIPAAYADTPFAMQYYFELKHTSGDVRQYPGFKPDFTGCPYFVIPRA